eukprot:1353974-Amorphochlora_amoeboformis.AAC.1
MVDLPIRFCDTCSVREQWCLKGDPEMMSETDGKHDRPNGIRKATTLTDGQQSSSSNDKAASIK